MFAGAAAVAALFHGVFLFGFNRRAEAPASPPPEEPVEVIAIVVPPLEDPDPVVPDEGPPVEDMSSALVPMQADLPRTVDVAVDFVQKIDVASLQQRPNLDNAKIISVPRNVGRGGLGAGGGIGKIFELSQLDRPPEPVFQPPPQFPPQLKREVQDATVEVVFIVTPKGEVVNAEVRRSTHPGFENAALAGVSRWRFKPGYKLGKPVNTRILVPLRFTIRD